MGFLAFRMAMPSRCLFLISLCCGAGLSCANSSASAKSGSPDDLAASVDFDLARHTSSRKADRRFRLADEDDPETFRSGKLGPRWSYIPISGGPTVEVGALGAGRKGTPKLAHVGVDWSF